MLLGHKTTTNKQTSPHMRPALYRFGHHDLGCCQDINPPRSKICCQHIKLQETKLHAFLLPPSLNPSFTPSLPHSLTQSFPHFLQCSADCGRGQRTREVVCVNSEDRPIAENKCSGTRPLSLEICDMGSCAKTWFYTEWSDEVSWQIAHFFK